MEAFIEKIIENYPRYLREEERFEYHLEARENPDMRDALTALRIRLGIIESWFVLLDMDERFALRLILTVNETAERRAAAMMWTCQLFKENQTPVQVRKRAIHKISAFASMHRKLMQAAFSDLWRH